jgi:capsular polysaccharide biosynthesis protein
VKIGRRAFNRLFQGFQTYCGLDSPGICDSLRVWAPSRPACWHMRLIYPSFSISPIVPKNLSEEAPAVAARYEANTELAFSGQFMFCLPNARVRGPHGFVVLDEGVFVLEGNWRVSNVVRHPLFSKAPLSKSRSLKGNWYSIISYFSGSYHHWLWDDLPRLLTAMPHLPLDTQFLIPENPKDYHLEALAALGIEQFRLHEHSAETETKVERLWFATPLGHSEWAATAPDVALKLREIFRNFAQPETKKQRKIYISRQNARQRRFVNESELLPSILKCGFEPVFAENLTFKKQVKLFAEANCILGIHGAGLTNMLFAKSGAQILEIQPDHPDSSRTHYWMMASTLGDNYKCMLGQSVLNNDPTKDHDLRVDPNRLEKILSSLK